MLRNATKQRTRRPTHPPHNAPNSAIELSGGSGFYGELVGKTIKNSGGTTIYYDRNLANSGLFSTPQFMPGNPMMSAFSWKTF